MWCCGVVDVSNVTMIVSGAAPPEPVLSGILHVLQSMRDEQQQFQSFVHARLDQLESVAHQRNAHQSDHAAFTSSLSASRSRSRSRRRETQTYGLSWQCPICEENFTHRESFKGHVRLCMLMQHQRCRLCEDNPKHQLLLGRFSCGTWGERGAAFTRAFYDQIRACTSTLDTDQQSHDHISAWLTVATSDDMHVPFPSYAAARPSLRKRRSALVSNGECVSGSSPDSVM
jgi:hypothetical protein